MNKRKTLAEFPEILRTWDYELNEGSIDPAQLSRANDDDYGKSFIGFFWKCSAADHSYPMKIRGRMKGSRCVICVDYIVPGFNDLFRKYPQFEPMWSEDLNNSPAPNNIAAFSRVPYWWNCSEGHESFKMKPRQLARSASEGIPLCLPCRMKNDASGKSVADVYPELVECWSPANLLDPDYFSFGTNRRALWICDKGHDDWSATPFERKFGMRLCPCCPGSHKLVVNCNDLGTTHPRVAERWDYDRNDKTPQDIKIGANNHFYFTCDQDPDHHPQMYLPNLRKNEEACTYCWTELVECPKNDLACSAPQLFKQWDAGANSHEFPHIDPHKIRSTDIGIFYWKCTNGKDHSFRATPYNRHKLGTKCTVCLNRTVIPGQNSLRALFPEIADQWLAEHNQHLLPLSPDTATPAGGAKVNWVCLEGKGHPPYPSVIGSRTTNGSGCPECASYGYKRSLPALLYLIERQDGEFHRAGRKIGITNVHSSKIRLRHWGYLGFEVIHTITDNDGGLIADLENLLVKDWIRTELGLGQWFSRDEMRGGETETFTPFGPTNDEVVEKMFRAYEQLCRNTHPQLFAESDLKTSPAT